MKISTGKKIFFARLYPPFFVGVYVWGGGVPGFGWAGVVDGAAAGGAVSGSAKAQAKSQGKSQTKPQDLLKILM